MDFPDGVWEIGDEARKRFDVANFINEEVEKALREYFGTLSISIWPGEKKDRAPVITVSLEDETLMSSGLFSKEHSITLAMVRDVSGYAGYAERIATQLESLAIDIRQMIKTGGN